MNINGNGTELSIAGGIYGDGSDGDVIFDGSATTLTLVPSASQYTLTTDIYPDNMTVNSGVSIRCNGFTIYCKSQLNNAGTIYGAVNHASGSTAGVIISATGTMQSAAGAGGDGRATAGAGTLGAGSGGRNISGSSSGAGGQADGSNAGGAGNTSALPTAIQGKVRSSITWIKGRLMDNLSLNGGGGGGGGGCNPGTGTATSGGGGSGSIPLRIFCKRLNNTGTIHANGGNGANGAATGDGKAGGGGAGSASAVSIICSEVVSRGTITATAGTPGTGAGGGATGGTGTDGFVFIFNQ